MKTVLSLSSALTIQQVPPTCLIPDGKIHRFSSNSRANDRAGWCVNYGDIGVIGDWRADTTITWSNRGKLSEPEQQQLDALTAEAEQIIDPYRDQLAVLSEQLNQELTPLSKQLKAIWYSITEKSGQLDESMIPRPEPETEWSDESKWLYDSNREYLDQLHHYKRHQGKAPKDLGR